MFTRITGEKAFQILMTLLSFFFFFFLNRNECEYELR